MIIRLSPQRRNETLKLEKDGDAIIINGERFDFHNLEEGARIERGDIESEYICGSVSKIKGKVHLTVILPHGKNASRERRFPDLIIDPPDGVIDLPE